MAPRLLEMNFAQKGGGVIMMCSLCVLGVCLCVCEGIVRGLCSCVGVEQVVNSDCSVERKKTRFRAYTREKLFKAKQLNKHTVFN